MFLPLAAAVLGCEFSSYSAKTPNGTCDDVKDDRLVTPGE